MAAMLASSRVTPRNFRNLFNLRQLIGDVKKPCSTAVRSVQRCYHISPSTKKCVLIVPKHQQCVRRDFHASVVCYDVVTVNTPAFADSISEGDVRWEKAVGDSVSEDEVVGEIETDKTSVPVMAPSAGVISELLVEDGATVTAGTALFKMDSSGAAAPAKPAETAATTPEPVPTPAAAAPAAAPAAAAGPIPTTPPPVPSIPTQPLATTPTSAIKPTPPVATASPTVGETVEGARTETRVKMNRMRLRIAQRLKDAQNTCAMLTTFNEIDMSNVMEMRKKYQDQFVKKHNIKVGFMSAFVKASAYALQQHPVVNAVIDENEIVYRDYVDISVAVATPKGLVVPVIRSAETMDYAGIEKYIAGLGEKARNNALAVEDMDGGTFTISNGGVFGSMFGTPIINPPQSAILGMHAIFDRPMSVGGGKIEVRPMMYVALTYDHRLVDGREAVTFLKTIKSTVEDPRSMLLGL